MMTKDALQELTKTPAITAANEAILSAGPAEGGLVSLPNDFALHDLERMLQTRRRARGMMKTHSAKDFASYVRQHAGTGTMVFVSQDHKRAEAVLNLGLPNAPGHADDVAIFEPKPTAAYSAMKAIANGAPRTQQQIAEYLEDWLHTITTCRNDDTEIQAKHAISAVRSITIEALRRVEAAEGQLSATRSALESVKARSGGDKPLPAEITLSFEPYQGMSTRAFTLRLSVHAGDKPAIALRISREEQHDEEMAQELVAIVTREIGDTAPVLTGEYKAKP